MVIYGGLDFPLTIHHHAQSVVDLDLKKIIIVYAGAFIGPFGGNAIIPLFGPIAAALVTDSGLVSLSITFLMVPFAIIQFFSGTISDLFKRQHICVIGLAIYGLGAILVGISPSLEFLLLSRVVQGIGYGILFPVLVALLGDLSTSEQRGKVMGYFGVFTTAGVAFGPLCAGILVIYSWDLIFYIAAGVALAVGGVFWFIYRDFPPASKDKRKIGDFFSQMKKTINWNILLFSGIGFFIFLSYIGVNISIGDRYALLFSLPENDPMIVFETGVMLGCAGLSGIFASVVAGLYLNKIGRKKTAFLGILILGLSLSLFPFGNSFITFIVLFLCLGTGAAIFWTAYNTITVELDPTAKGTVSSISSGFRFFGYSLASPFYIIIGLPTLYFASTFFALLVLGLLFLLGVSQMLPTQE